VARIYCGVTRQPVSLDELTASIRERTWREGGGAIVVFQGYVKGVVEGEEVEYLEYTAYQEYAEEALCRLAREVAEGHGVLEAHVYHRVGRLGPGEPTIYIVVAARGRREAFSAAAELLERVKHEAPIFKLEKRSSGEYWVLGDKRIPRREVVGLAASGEEDGRAGVEGYKQEGVGGGHEPPA